MTSNNNRSRLGAHCIWRHWTLAIAFCVWPVLTSVWGEDKPNAVQKAKFEYPSEPFELSESEDFYEPLRGSGNFVCDSCKSCNSRCCGLLGCRIWIRPEYAHWWLQGNAVPPLVTTSPRGTDRTIAGQLDRSSTTTLYGGDQIGGIDLSGGRIRFGVWLDPAGTRSIEASYLRLSPQNREFSASSASNSILARPFFNVESGFVGQDAEFVSYPGAFDGSIQVIERTGFETFELHYRHAVSGHRFNSLNYLLGWRYNRLDDRLLIQDSKTSLDPTSGIALGTTFQEFDQFITRNTFNGAQIGISQEQDCGGCSLEFVCKLGIGLTNTQTTLNGQTTITSPVPGTAPDVSVTPTGLLVQQTNRGSREINSFSVLPEVGATLGYQIANNCRLRIGYSFMYWPTAVRTGNRIDPQLNLSQLTPDGLVGTARPLFSQTGSGMWAQGLNAGLDFRF